MESSSLQTVYSWSCNLNNMISLSLMKDPSSKYGKIFIFLNCTPSFKQPDGSRKYDFKSGISYKLQHTKLYEIYAVISSYVRGQGRMIGPYSILNDSSKSSYNANSGGQMDLKSVYITYVPADEEKNKGVPQIGIIAKHGNKTISTFLPAPMALAFAEMCKKIFDEAVKLDIVEFTPPAYQRRGEDFGGSEEPKKKAPYSPPPVSGGSESFPTFTDEEAPF